MSAMIILPSARSCTSSHSRLTIMPSLPPILKHLPTYLDFRYAMGSRACSYTGTRRSRTALSLELRKSPKSASKPLTRRVQGTNRCQTGSNVLARKQASFHRPNCILFAAARVLLSMVYKLSFNRPAKRLTSYRKCYIRCTKSDNGS